MVVLILSIPWLWGYMGLWMINVIGCHETKPPVRGRTLNEPTIVSGTTGSCNSSANWKAPFLKYPMCPVRCVPLREIRPVKFRSAIHYGHVRLSLLLSSVRIYLQKCDLPLRMLYQQKAFSAGSSSSSIWNCGPKSRKWGIYRMSPDGWQQRHMKFCPVLRGALLLLRESAIHNRIVVTRFSGVISPNMRVAYPWTYNSDKGRKYCQYKKYGKCYKNLI